MPSDSQAASYLFKRAQRKADTLDSREAYNESLVSSPPIYPQQIWADRAAIPAVAPSLADGVTLGVVKYFDKHLLTPVAGSAVSFFSSELKNAVLDDVDVSYIPRVFFDDGTSAGELPFGVGDWIVDPAASILRFYDLGSLSTLINSDHPPAVSFYKYVGALGIALPAGDESTVSGATAPVAHPAPSDSVAVFAFDDASNFGKDLVGSNDGTVTGALAPVPGKIGDLAADFAGGANFITVSHNSAFDKPAGAGLSVTAWVRPAALGAASTVVHKFAGAADFAYSLGLSSSDKVTLSIRDAANAETVGLASGTSVTTDWAAVAVSVSPGGEIRLYVNGALEASQTFAGGASAVVATAADILIGSDGGGTHLNAALDDLRFNSRAMTAREIEFLHAPWSSASGIEQSNTIATAVRKLDRLIGLVAPPPDPGLAAFAMAVAGGAAARRADMGALVSGVTNALVISTEAVGLFHDGAVGTLAAVVDSGSGAVTVDQIPLTDGDDSGTGPSGFLVITSNPVAGSGLYRSLSSRVDIPAGQRPPASSSAAYSMQLSHSTTGAATPATFRVEDDAASAPVSVAATVTGVSGPTGGVYVSGLLQYTAADQITVSVTPTNAIRKFYTTSNIVDVSGAEVVAGGGNPGTVTPDSNPTYTIAVNFAPSVSSSSVSVTATARNALGATATAVAASAVDPIRIDTASQAVNESAVRFVSGKTRYPTRGGAAGEFGEVFVSATLLTDTSAAFELQLLNGVFQFPPAVNYTTGTLPVTAGADYTSLATDSDPPGVRWVTFQPTAVVEHSSLDLAFVGASGLTGAPYGTANFYCYLAVYTSGGAEVTKWIDCNAPFTGGAPGGASDGAGGVSVIDSPAAAQRRITFGTAPRTGDVWVRVGLTAASGIALAGVTATPTPN